MNEESEKILTPLLAAVRTADNKLSQSVVSRVMKIDADWVTAIEDTMHSLENIAANPKSFIKDTYELVNVEKARRVDSYALRHLSGHTENVRSVGDDGRVVPKKVMNRQMETDNAIYENRVVYALIVKLVDFVETRYEKIVELSKVRDNLAFSVDSAFGFGQCKVTYGLKINVEKPSEDSEITDVNAAMLARLEAIRIRLKTLQYSPFAKELSGCKLIVPPVQKTNIFSGNIDYANCYRLWAYLSAFDTLGYGVTVRTKNLPFDDDYFQSLVDVEMHALRAVMENDIARKALYTGIDFTTRKEKRYREIKKVSFDTLSPEGKLFDGGEIGQYYYDSIMALTKDIARTSKASDVEAVKEVPTTLRRFYKGLVQINNKMVDELMHPLKPEKQYKTAFERLTAKCAESKRELRKLQLLQQLKYDEWLLAKKKTERQLARIEKDEEKLAALREKREKARLLKKEKQLAAKEAARLKAQARRRSAEEKKKAAEILSENTETPIAVGEEVAQGVTAEFAPADDRTETTVGEIPQETVSVISEEKAESVEISEAQAASENLDEEIDREGGEQAAAASADETAEEITDLRRQTEIVEETAEISVDGIIEETADQAAAENIQTADEKVGEISDRSAGGTDEETVAETTEQSAAELLQMQQSGAAGKENADGTEANAVEEITQQAVRKSKKSRRETTGKMLHKRQESENEGRTLKSSARDTRRRRMERKER